MVFIYAQESEREREQLMSVVICTFLPYFSSKCTNDRLSNGVDWCTCTFRLQLMCLWWERQRYRKKARAFTEEVSVNLIRPKMEAISTPYLSTFHIVCFYSLPFRFISFFVFDFLWILLNAHEHLFIFELQTHSIVYGSLCFNVYYLGRWRWRQQKMKKRMKNELKFRINCVIAHERTRWQSTHCCGTVFFPYAIECGKNYPKEKKKWMKKSTFLFVAFNWMRTGNASSK